MEQRRDRDPELHDSKCILLTGLSGNGKSSVGPLVAARLPNCTFIEGDSFYRAEKPTIVLSTGERVANWDSADAIDWEKLNAEVTARLRDGHIILATFVPRPELMKFPVTLHVRLDYSLGRDPQVDISRCIAARRSSKKFATAAKEERDELMVREVVYPTYAESVARCPSGTFPGQAVVYTYCGEDRRDLQEIVGDIASIASRYLQGLLD